MLTKTELSSACRKLILTETEISRYNFNVTETLIDALKTNINSTEIKI